MDTSGSSYSPVFSSASVRPQDGACLKFPGFLPRTKHLQRWCSFQYGSWPGYMILIYVAGFMGLSEDVLEAASIDGASGWVKMKNIILPLMMSSVTICLFLTLSRAFMVYDVNLSLTGGAPYGTTEMAAMHVYESIHIETVRCRPGRSLYPVYHCSLHQRYSGIHHQEEGG